MWTGDIYVDGDKMIASKIMNFGRILAFGAAVAVAPMLSVTQAKAAAGDLLVAPTRIVFNGTRGTEVILNNIGNETATYRISLELRRMNKRGGLDEIAIEDATDKEKLAMSLIRFAPKRVTLAPDQPQSIRVGLNPAARNLDDGEYRVHMLFRAIPKVSAPSASAQPAVGFKIQLTPIYGVTIPLIIRRGNLQADASLTSPRMTSENNRPVLEFDMTRTGNRSVYGNVEIKKPGVAEPIIKAKGIAIYPETESRVVSLPMPPQVASQLSGPVTIAYRKPAEAGGGLIAEVKAVLP